MNISTFLIKLNFITRVVKQKVLNCLIKLNFIVDFIFLLLYSKFNQIKLSEKGANDNDGTTKI